MKIFSLPNEYKEYLKIDLQKNIKIAIFVNALALVIAIIFFLIGIFIKPISITMIFNCDNPFKPLFTYLIILFFIIVYMVLHELVHGVFFKKFSGEKAKYGFTGMYAFAKSDAFYNKKEYLIIGLSPIVILGVFLLLLNIFLDYSLFWYVYVIQIANISGAAGDLYVGFKLRKLPNDILIKDAGVSMTIYSK